MAQSALQQFQQLVSEITPVYGENEAKSIVYLLVEHFGGVSKMDILLDNPLKKEVDYSLQIQQLKQQQPIQYMIGETEFYGRIFKVSPATLIPRPETEELIQLAIESYRLATPKVAPHILDIGTGSGCIAISMAAELPNALVTAFDISEEALVIAQQNALTNQVNVDFKQVDILENNDSDTIFDIILSNPPYVTNAEKVEMEKNVLEYEPHLALFVADDNPLIFYKTIAKFAANHLPDNGLCIVEINQAFGLETAQLFWDEGFHYVEVLKDFFGKDRMVKAIL